MKEQTKNILMDEFIPYEEALYLKELGFDEPCFGYFINNKQNITLSLVELHNSDFSRIFNDIHFRLVSPLFQQAFDYLLKAHSLYAVIIPTITMNWTFKTMTVVDDMIEVPPYNHVDANDYNTFKEARLGCLKKLIEIIKEQNK